MEEINQIAHFSGKGEKIANSSIKRNNQMMGRQEIK